jgi:hypothetical protein
MNSEHGHVKGKWDDDKAEGAGEEVFEPQSLYALA